MYYTIFQSQRLGVLTIKFCENRNFCQIRTSFRIWHYLTSANLAEIVNDFFELGGKCLAENAKRLHALQRPAALHSFV